MATTISRTTALLWLIGAIAACNGKPPPPPPVPTVGYVVVQAHRVPLIREFLATIDGATTAQIQPQVTGYIREVNYKEGSVVDKGQLLFTLDTRPFIAAVDKARGDYEAAVAQLDKSRADVARYTPLVAQHAVSKEQLDNARAAVLGAQGNVASTKGALQTAKLNLEWAEVRSPITGLAGIAQTRVGTLVNPNQVLTVVSALDPIRALFTISQQEYLRYADAINRPNAPDVARQRYFELLLVNGRIYPHHAHDIIVNRQIDPTTGTLQIQALFPNPDRILRPGLFGKVRVHIGNNTLTPLVPERALTELQGQYQVSVLDADGRVQVRRLQLGPLMGHEYAVESGLAAGERVLVEGQQNAIPGTRVNARLVDAGAPLAHDDDGGEPLPDGGAATGGGGR